MLISPGRWDARARFSEASQSSLNSLSVSYRFSLSLSLSLSFSFLSSLPLQFVRVAISTATRLFPTPPPKLRLPEAKNTFLSLSSSSFSVFLPHPCATGGRRMCLYPPSLSLRISVVLYRCIVSLAFSRATFATRVVRFEGRDCLPYREGMGREEVGGGGGCFRRNRGDFSQNYEPPVPREPGRRDLGEVPS